MSIIEQATKRLEELSRAGVAVPWAAAGLAQDPERGPAAPPQTVPEAVTGAVDIRLVGPVRPSPVRDAAKPPAPGGRRARARVVTLDLAKLEREGNLVPSQSRSLLSEEFRQIKRPLLSHTRSKDAVKNRSALIMVTSAMPGEGKTFSAINLAMSIANEIDKSVLLVDVDVVRLGLTRRLGVEAEVGLLDLLTDPTLAPEDVILETNVPKLSLLPPGKRNSYSTELLASEAMERLLLSLTSDCPGRIVVFDAPPLLVTTEAKVLATRVGQVVLIVEAGSTQRSEVEQAFAAVEQCPNVSAILNKAHQSEVPGGYVYCD